MLTRGIQCFSMLPSILCAICFVAFPIALSRATNISHSEHFLIISTVLCCWIASVILGFTIAPSDASTYSSRISKRFAFQVLLQFSLFGTGVTLCYLG